MTDDLLHSLRDHVLDESASLAGLLRTCLMLSADTGSSMLRAWASSELNGYRDDQEVPAYRKISAVLRMNSISGYTHTTGQTISRLNLPAKAQSFVLEEIPFRQPLEEIECLSSQKSIHFSSTGLAAAMSIWNAELRFGQQVTGLSYLASGATLAGAIGRVRTALVDLVADLTAETPLYELPRRERVDKAVRQRIGDIYNTTIHTAGSVAIGTGAQAAGLAVEEALQLLDELRRMAEEQTGAAERGELLKAVAQVRDQVDQPVPDPSEVQAGVGKLRAFAAKTGSETVRAAVSTAVTKLTEMAVSGTFG